VNLVLIFLFNAIIMLEVMMSRNFTLKLDEERIYEGEIRNNVPYGYGIESIETFGVIYEGYENMENIMARGNCIIQILVMFRMVKRSFTKVPS
jgi:hypothetical protein